MARPEKFELRSPWRNIRQMRHRPHWRNGIWGRPDLHTGVVNVSFDAVRRGPTAQAPAWRYSNGCRDTRGKDMVNILKTLTVLAFGSVLLAGCGANKDESAAQTGTPSPAAETPAPAPEDTTSPADTTDTMPADEPDPAMSDTLPTDEEPPPPEPAPPPNG